MNFFLLFVLIMSIKVRLSYAYFLQCSHSRYFLNFFNHNERFLLEFEKNKDYITIKNLMNYGKALQTHSEVIMIFLDDLMNNKKSIIPLALITLNMYLNNVSGSLNMISLTEDGEKNDATKLLEGYKIIHVAVKNQLKNFIINNCENIPFIDYMVSCNPPIRRHEYTTTNLININNHFKDNILKKFYLSVERNSYENFHPKNFLFYEIMTQQIISNKNNIIKIDNSKHIELNLLRFTPLNVQCSDGTRLTIQDLFEYMKYDFNSKDVLEYINMVILATFQPIAILIRNFLTLIIVASSENSDSVPKSFKWTLIKTGRIILNYIGEFISLGLFNEVQTAFLRKIINEFIFSLNNYIRNIELSNVNIKYSNKLIILITNFFIKNKFYFTSYIVLRNENINENNANEIQDQLEKIMQNVDTYMKDLKKWNSYLQLIIKMYKLNFKLSIYNYLTESEVSNLICDTETHFEIYNASRNDCNNIDIGFFKKDYITEYNLEMLQDDPDKNDTLKNQTVIPLYMIDYLPYNM
ncbi:uncharacterized protein LOC126900883 isoform X1 [Daktulosphaira vitifoliae]|uniref:uncharacterized protein LOC126900883 isoform X1 n=2 Tax=Daktulosphaira vitifoliae TaxID=58002 RepID=UPI0021A9EE47|nr:uncharacterized protein LOC126900883 isoform X1 [Daktulosphaira vitifoliae]